MQFSYSRLRMHAECPMQYRLAYVDGVRRADAEIVDAGKIAHAIYAAYRDHCVQRGAATDITSLPRIAQSAYGQYCEAHAAAARPILVNRAAFDTLVRDLVVPFGETHLFDLDRNLAAEQPVAITEQFEDVTDSNWDGAWFRAVLDVLEAGDDLAEMRVVDYKTGWNAEPDWLQAEVYAWLVLGLQPHVAIVEVVFDFVRFNVQKRRVYARHDWEALDDNIRDR